MGSHAIEPRLRGDAQPWIEIYVKAGGNGAAGGVECLAMNPNLPGSLEDQIGELRSRIRLLEEALEDYGIVVEKQTPVFPAQAREMTPPQGAQSGAAQPQPTPAQPQPAAPTQAIGLQQPPPFPQPPPGAPPPPQWPAAQMPPRAPFPPVRPPNFGYPATAPQKDGPSLESRIGSQWFNRIGILAVLIAVAWFLKYAFDNHWIGPLGRVAFGLVAGAALIAWSERFQRRGFAPFAYSLKAVGSGTLYLALWAAFSVYQLIPAGAAFGAMIVVTALNGLMCWTQDSELLALYATAGGLITPLLVSTGENHEITLFSYLLILDLAVLALAALRPWSRLLFLAFVGTVLFVTGWWFEFYSQEQAGRTALFLVCFFLTFALAPRLTRIDVADSAPSSAWDALAMVVLPMATAGLGFLAFYMLLDPATAEWAGPWLAVAFGAFYLMLLRLPAWGVLRSNTALLSALHLATAVVFLTIAIPLKAHGGRWLTIGWLAEGAALFWVASRARSMLLRVLALGCLALGLLALVETNPPASTVPFFNERFGTYCVAIAVFAFVAWVARKAHEKSEPDAGLSWTGLAAAAALVISLLILIAIGWEIHSYWWLRRWTGDWTQMQNYQMYAQFTYSAFFMFYGAVLLSAGFWRHSAFLRWQALVLLAVAIAKVFLFDMSQLSQGFRILSFLGLGALLLAVSFVYQRDWLNLRGQGGRKS